MLERREVVGQRELAVVAVFGTVDRPVRGDRDRRPDVRLVAVAVQAAAGVARLGVLLIRYCRPSSKRRW